MSIGGIFSDTARLYRRLFLRSTLVALLIFAPISFIGALPALGGERVGFSLLLAFLAQILSFVGALLVQGALAHAVKDVHEQREPDTVGRLYERTRGRLWALVVASILAAIGIGLASLLLVVPGLILWTRWSLLVPVIVLERRPVGEAFGRSRELVRGHGWKVFWLLVLVFVLAEVLRILIGGAFSFLPSFPQAWLGGLVANTLVTPFQAHTLTALYYSLLEPERPVVPAEKAKGWQSVWDEEEHGGSQGARQLEQGGQ